VSLMLAPCAQAFSPTDNESSVRWKLIVCDLVLVIYLFAISLAITAIAYNSTVQEVRMILIR
jgi:hypothetical protein